MPENTSLLQIVSKLDQLGHSDPAFQVFGASEHKYELAPPVTESTLNDLEQQYGVRLPEDYRQFLTTVGDGFNRDAECGGAGPGYGLYSVSTLATISDLLARPFPLTHSILQVIELCESDAYWAVWSDANSKSSCGMLPLAHYGCGIHAMMVLNGDSYGTVWIIDGASGDLAHFADYSRYHCAGGGSNAHANGRTVDGPHSFLMWYEDWLDGSLSPSNGSAGDPLYLPGAYVVPEKPYEPPPIVPCPECGEPLRTAQAKQCLGCGADWHHD